MQVRILEKDHNMTERRSSCPIASTLDEIGDRWSLLIVRDIYFSGKHRFEEFLQSPEKISTNILTDRLKRLGELGLITKQPYGAHSLRMDYFLTERGQKLGTILEALVQWGLDNIEGTKF
jgi:DNA-binding HxlR family transcriptional regulator